jgi:hypothetical protein
MYLASTEGYANGWVFHVILQNEKSPGLGRTGAKEQLLMMGKEDSTHQEVPLSLGRRGVVGVRGNPLRGRERGTF